MKFRNVNVHNVNDLIPSWAIDPIALARYLDRLFDDPHVAKIFARNHKVLQKLDYWIEIDTLADPPSIRVCSPDEDADNRGLLILKCRGKLAGNADLVIPLNPFLKGYPRISGKHLVYCHAFQTDVPLAYIGISKQRWFDRLSQHVSSARAGSPYLFHRALIEHQEKPLMHKVFICDVSLESALNFEEEFVGHLSLYPLGLNMIPGGKAGIAYLRKLGVAAKSLKERDQALEMLARQDQIGGRPNPLCAARWATDDQFVERVICGHSGRLTADQVRRIRLLASFGKSEEQIMQLVSARNYRQVENVMKANTYSRIK